MLEAFETVNGHLPDDIDDLREFTDGDLSSRWVLQVDTTTFPSTTVITVVGINDCA